MKYFIDTEFIEDGKTIDLISIGIVSEDGRELYQISSEYDESKANDWVKENVLNHISKDCVRITKQGIKDSILAFIGSDKPEFWGYYSDYDWVVFSQLFGRMIDLPRGWPMYCRDLRQLLDSKGLNDVSQPDNMPHEALSDARWIKTSFQMVSA